jgi:large subunit ribosomal protein L17
MRHLKRNAKLGRKGAHRNAMLANMVCSLIKNKRVTTTLAKAKAVRPVAEKMVTLGKKGSIHHRRLAASRLHQEDAVQVLFNEIAPEHQDRAGGYTRIIKLHERRGDAAQMAIIEFVESGAASAEDSDNTKQEIAASDTPTASTEEVTESSEETVATEEPKAESADVSEGSSEDSESKGDEKKDA